MIGAIIGALASMASNSINQMHSDKVRREQNIFNQYEAQRAREWNQQMDSTKYQRTVNDMASAGINPALAMSGPVSTQATSNAQASSSNVPVPQVDLSSIAQIYMQQRQLDQNQKLVDSQARKNNAEAENMEITNKYADEYNNLMNAGMKLQNDLTYNQSKEVLKNIDRIDATIDLLRKQADTEVERRALTIAERALKEAMKDKTESEKLQIVTLLPFQEKLMEAQTNNQKAQASLALVEAAYKQGLIDNGYITDLCKQMKAAAESAEYKAIIDKVMAAFESGDVQSFFDDVKQYFKDGKISSGMTGIMFAVVKMFGKVLGNTVGSVFGPLASGVLK